MYEGVAIGAAQEEIEPVPAFGVRGAIADDFVGPALERLRDLGVLGTAEDNGGDDAGIGVALESSAGVEDGGGGGCVRRACVEQNGAWPAAEGERHQLVGRSD